MSLHVAPLSPERHADWLAFFEGKAFCDNPKWASCYCAYNYLDHAVVHWQTRTAADNKASMAGWIASGHAQGWLAYRDESVIGWLNAAPRSHYPSYAQGNADDALTGALSCFIVAPDCRRQGIAAALLEAACADFARRGFACVEAWPNRQAGSAAAHYHGPLALYLAHGFTICDEPAGSDLITVRRDLRTTA